MTIDPWLRERLACPAARTPLRLDVAERELVSEAAGLAYPIRDGVPVLLAEAARQLDRELAAEQQAARHGSSLAR